jgi:5'-nucleotidase
MRILVSNDDGVYSPGIAALAKAANRFGEVRIVAPDVEQSSMGHAITASRPLRLKRIHLDSFDAYRVNGTPADCVALGMHRWGHVDVVLSGINLGLNLGNSCWHFRHACSGETGSIVGLAWHRVQHKCERQS